MQREEKRDGRTELEYSRVRLSLEAIGPCHSELNSGFNPERHFIVPVVSGQKVGKGQDGSSWSFLGASSRE